MDRINEILGSKAVKPAEPKEDFIQMLFRYLMQSMQNQPQPVATPIPPAAPTPMQNMQPAQSGGFDPFANYDEGTGQLRAGSGRRLTR